MKLVALASLLLVAACSDHSGAAGDDDMAMADAPPGPDVDAGTDAVAAMPPMVIVIPFENKSTVDVYSDPDAPYINSLMATAAYATNFKDELPTSVPSEPHYVWMESGTNVFSDYTFLTDNDASSTNSTATTEHLSTQLDAAGISWKSYQQGITDGTCPIKSTGFYAAKHDPFVFFKDVSGSPPSASNTRCAEHHGSFAKLASDMQNNAMPRYAFITPDLCHDMHGASSCPSGTGASVNVRAGDTWLKDNLQGLIDYAHAHNGVVLLVWDEGNNTSLIPFLAIGDHVVPGPDATLYNHSSQLALIERILGVPKLSKVASANDMSAMFQAGWLP